MSEVTIAEAAELTGKTRETINLATREGRLSFSRNRRNWKVVDVSELGRVFELVKTVEELRRRQSAAEPADPAADWPAGAGASVLQERLRHSEEMREAITADRERERRQLTDEIENLRESLRETQTSLRKSQEEHGRAMLLLTDQSRQNEGRDGEWGRAVEAIEERVAGRTSLKLKAMQATHEKEINKWKRALHAERKKTLWQRVFN